MEERKSEKKNTSYKESASVQDRYESEHREITRRRMYIYPNKY